MNDRYELTRRSSTGLGMKIRQVCREYSMNVINADELVDVISYYIKNYADILFDGDEINQTIVKVIGKKRVAFIKSQVEARHI